MREKDLTTSSSRPPTPSIIHLVILTTAKEHISDSAEDCTLTISLLCTVDYFAIKK